MRLQLNKFLLALSAAALLLGRPVFADSPYDGIWEQSFGGLPPSYYSITITDGQVLLISFDEVAHTSQQLYGAYIGSVRPVNGSSALPTPPFDVNVKTEPRPAVFNRSWSFDLKFLSDNTAQLSEPWPWVISPRPLQLRKIF